LGGWLILVAILGMGGWIGRNANQKQISFLLRLFLSFFLLTLFISIIYFSMITLDGSINSFMAGLIANRNSFAFLFIAVLCISTVFYLSNNRLLPSSFNYALFFMMPFFLLLNGSRAAWITIGILLIAMAVIHRHKLKKIVILALFAAAGTASLHGTYSLMNKDVAVLNPRVMGVFQGNPEDYGGDQIRIAVLKFVLPMIEERPVLGSGLGSIMMEQQQKNGQVINLLDNTGLWLLAETGIIGLIAFAFFYFLIVRQLFRNIAEDEEFSKTLRQSILFLILGFTIMCLFHEFLYTRFLWFFLGLSLALPAKMRQAV
jgi:O-antigen ligase